MFRIREKKRKKVVEKIAKGDYVLCASGTVYEVLLSVKNIHTDKYEVILKTLSGHGEKISIPMEIFLKEKSDLKKYPDYPQEFLFEKIKCVDGKWILGFI